MKTRYALFPLALLLLLFAGTAVAKGTLKGPYRIESRILGYALQYWVYLPEDAVQPLPELFVTDGQAYLSAGDLVDVLDAEYEKGRIEPFAVIFVDSRDPDFPDVSRRNREFMCNVDYAKFFVGELMPKTSGLWTGAGPTTKRGIMGVSFGAINSACFGVMLPGVFQLLIMHSPASEEHLEVIDGLYRQRPTVPSAFFISHGGADDNGPAAQRFVQTLQDKGYTVKHITTEGVHDWPDWRPLMDDSLQAFSALIESDADPGPASAGRPDDASSDGQ